MTLKIIRYLYTSASALFSIGHGPEDVIRYVHDALLCIWYSATEVLQTARRD